MSLLSLIFGNKPKTASVAKERLQLIIAHERNGATSKQDFLPDLQKDLIAVISKYVSVNPDDIKVSLEKQGNYEVLEVNIVLPEPANKRKTRAKDTEPEAREPTSRNLWSLDAVALLSPIHDEN